MVGQAVFFFLRLNRQDPLTNAGDPMTSLLLSLAFAISPMDAVLLKPPAQAFHLHLSSRALSQLEPPALAVPQPDHAPPLADDPDARPHLVVPILEVSSLVLLDALGVGVLALKGVPVRAALLDGVGALTGAVVGGVVVGAVGALVAGAICAATCSDNNPFSLANPTSWLGRGAAKDLLQGLLIAVFVAAGIMVGGVLGAPPGVAIAEKLQGRAVSGLGWGLGHLTALGAGAAGALVASELTDENANFEAVALPLGAAGVLIWSVAGYSIVAR